MIARQSNTTEKKGIHVLFLNFETVTMVTLVLHVAATANSLQRVNNE